MVSITLEDVTVNFPIYNADRNFRRYLLRPGIGGLLQNRADGQRHTSVTALRNISCTMAEGDRVGLVGLNGAGKSTLLHTLSGVYAPVAGQVRINGQVSTLTNTNIGIDPDDTGIRNIRSCGLALGMTPAEIEAKTDQIVAFTELGDYIHLPVRTYSSGMVMRVAFAIATSLDPDILLMDEIIGAGDASFHHKATRRIEQMMSRVRILVVASHTNDVLRLYCNKAMLLHKGDMLAWGDLESVLAQYEELTREAAG